MTIRSFIGTNGDCYDRYLIRMREMSESVNIINQVVQKINLNYFDVNKNVKVPQNQFNNSFYSYLDYTTSYLLRSMKKFKQST